MRNNSDKSLITDIGTAQLTKHSEELCGDQITTTSNDDSAIVVLSDGLGSGVKANILSTMTVRMASTMLEKGGNIDEVMGTMAETLPICQVRRLAYSTLTILQIDHSGIAYLAEYDNPLAFIGRGNRSRKVTRSERVIGERKIKEAKFEIQDGDWIVLTSDGVLHAGIGGKWNLGWGWERVEKYLKLVIKNYSRAQEVADDIAQVVNKLYDGTPGDDASIVVVKIKQPEYLSVMIGPPEDPDRDPQVVETLINLPGKKAVCGGTTGNIVARELDRELKVDLHSDDEEIPPTASLEGIELVTEGVLTISRVLRYLHEDISEASLRGKSDGASRLTDLLLKADVINFLVGRTINAAHQAEDMPSELALKSQIVQELIDHLEERGKEITIEYY